MNPPLQQKYKHLEVEKKSLKGYLLLVAAALTCSCHLPLLLALLAGTGLGSFLKQNFWIALLVLTAVFLVSLRGALQRLKAASHEEL